MNALAPIATKLAKTIPMLGSDNPAEKVAAVCAIERLLAAAGCDLHDLAAALQPPPTIRAPEEPTGPYIADAVKALLCCDRISAWERTFLNDIARRLWDGRGVSQSQAAKVQEIYAQRIGGAR